MRRSTPSLPNLLACGCAGLVGLSIGCSGGGADPADASSGTNASSTTATGSGGNGNPSSSSGPKSGGGGQDNTGACALPKYPDATCTGVPPGTSLKRVPEDATSGPGWAWSESDGALEVTEDNAVVDSVDVSGCILANAAGVTVKSSKAQCISTAFGTRGRDTSLPRLTIQDCEVICPDMDGTTGIGDRNIDVFRVDIHGCENGFDMDSDADIEDSYIHDLHQSVLAHTDGLQSAVGSNLIINHNRFYGDTFGACGTASGHTDDCGGTSAINVNANPMGPVSTGSTISNNLLAGGAYTLYCPAPMPVSFKVLNNHWSRLFYPNGGAFGADANCLQDDGTPIVSEWSNNVWDDTAAPIGP